MDIRLKVKGSTTVVNKNTFRALIVNCVKEETIINSPEIFTKLRNGLAVPFWRRLFIGWTINAK